MPQAGTHQLPSNSAINKVHTELAQGEDQVEMQLQPTFQWANEQQQQPSKIAILQLQNGGGDQERTIRNVLNAAGLKYTINRQTATLHGDLSGLEEVRLQPLQHSIKLPMTPTEGASQLTIHQVTKANVSRGFEGVQYFCKIGTIEYLSCHREPSPLPTRHQRPCQATTQRNRKQHRHRRPHTRASQPRCWPQHATSTHLPCAHDCAYLQTPPYACTISTPTQGDIKVQLQHCGMRVNLQPPRKAIIRMQDTMADVHDTLIGRHQALPSKGAKGQRLGIADTGTIESIMRTQRVTIVDTYEGASKTRVLVVRDQITAVAIDARVNTSEAHELYEQLNLTKWQGRYTNQQQNPSVTTYNVTLADYYKSHTPSQSCLLHLRVARTQPYLLPKPNADIRAGKYDATQREAIQLLLIVPLPNKALLPYISTEPTRTTSWFVVGFVVSRSGFWLGLACLQDWERWEFWGASHCANRSFFSIGLTWLLLGGLG